MRDRLHSLLPSVLALSLVLLLTIPAVTVAQTGLPPKVSMHPESAGPGATVEVTGLDFPADTTVSLRLSTAQGWVDLATAATSSEGMFREVVTLPAETPAGEWELLARAASGSGASYAFDPAAPAAGAEAPAEATTTTGNSFGDIIFMLIIASILGVIFTAVLFAYRLIQEERAQPGMGTGDDLIWSGASSRAVAPELTATSEPFWKTAPPEPEPTPAEGTEIAAQGEQEVPASA